MLKLVVIASVLLFGCAKQTATSRVTDSTTNSVRKTSDVRPFGPPTRTFRGPADIIGDTAKNARNPAMVREK